MQLTTGILIISITLTLSMIIEILLFLANWYYSEKRLHKLKIDAHNLRLRLKQDSAERIYNEYIFQHYPSESNVIIADEEAA